MRSEQRRPWINRHQAALLVYLGVPWALGFLLLLVEIDSREWTPIDEHLSVLSGGSVWHAYQTPWCYFAAAGIWLLVVFCHLRTRAWKAIN